MKSLILIFLLMLFLVIPAAYAVTPQAVMGIGALIAVIAGAAMGGKKIADRRREDYYDHYFDEPKSVKWGEEPGKTREALKRRLGKLTDTNSLIDESEGLEAKQRQYLKGLNKRLGLAKEEAEHEEEKLKKIKSVMLEKAKLTRSIVEAFVELNSSADDIIRKKTETVDEAGVASYMLLRLAGRLQLMNNSLIDQLGKLQNAEAAEIRGLLESIITGDLEEEKLAEKEKKLRAKIESLLETSSRGAVGNLFRKLEGRATNNLKALFEANLLEESASKKALEAAADLEKDMQLMRQIAVEQQKVLEAVHALVGGLQGLLASKTINADDVETVLNELKELVDKLRDYTESELGYEGRALKDYVEIKAEVGHEEELGKKEAAYLIDEAKLDEDEKKELRAVKKILRRRFEKSNILRGRFRRRAA
ncbi:hypothetical protein KY361_04580 [Candidatus Woesearchaeota archaeon]|nr:hypothetical protein [Candidatus Woesearchaeota archaeon]